MKIQIKIDALKKIIEEAEGVMKFDAARSNTIELTLIKKCDTHEGNDLIQVDSKCIYAECDSMRLFIIGEEATV